MNKYAKWDGQINKQMLVNNTYQLKCFNKLKFRASVIKVNSNRHLPRMKAVIKKTNVNPM